MLEFEKGFGSSEMIELRHRTLSGTRLSNFGYQQLSTDDDLDEIPNIDRPAKVAPIPRSSICKFYSVCSFNQDLLFFVIGGPFFFVFSLSGVIFLSSIYVCVRQNSPYVKLERNSTLPNDNDEFADGIFTAIMMYSVCTFLSLLYWYKSSRQFANRRFDD